MVLSKSKGLVKKSDLSKTKISTKRSGSVAKATSKKASSQPIKPRVRVSRVSVGLGMKRPNPEGVVDLKGLAKTINQPSTDLKLKPKSGPRTSRTYGSDAYDEDLDRGELNFDDELVNEPVESLGELLDDEERLTYEDEVVAKTVNQKLAKAERARNFEADNGRIYKKLAIGFVVLVAITAVVVAYFVLVKVRIEVGLKNEALTGELPFKIYDQASGEALSGETLKGLVKKIDMEQTKSFPASGNEVIGEEVSGKMIIYNKYIKNQPLVATTRLLSADGKLFRLKNSINVPAGGQTEVEVYADQPRPDMVVGDERFTIPGLWEGLQDKVYAQSKAGEVIYRKKVKGIISQEDIDKAIKEMREALVAQAKTQIENTYGDFNKQLYQLDEASVITEVDSKAGEEKEQMVVKIKGSVLAVAFNGEAALVLAKNKAVGSLPAGKELVDLKDEAVTYQLLKVDAINKSAEVSAAYAGQVTVTSLDDLINKSKLTNLNEGQLAAYLKSLPEIDTFKINFYPPFIKKTPALVDRIQITLEK